MRDIGKNCLLIYNYQTFLWAMLINDKFKEASANSHHPVDATNQAS